VRGREQPNGARLMTVGELSEQTGVSRKAIRELEGRGLIYTAGRSESNYRLFGEEALWCVQMITGLRSLGLTVGEIEQFAAYYLARPNEPPGPRLDVLLERVDRRVQAQRAELEQILARVAAFRAANTDALAGKPGAELGPPDPRRSRGRAA
jgi:MerR family copper efflux transcriptional regulator